MTLDEARAVAAQAWTDPETSAIVMDVALAEAFAKRLVEVTKPRAVCIGWTTIKRVANEGAVYFGDVGVVIIAADDLFQANVK